MNTPADVTERAIFTKVTQTHVRKLDPERRVVKRRPPVSAKYLLDTLINPSQRASMSAIELARVPRETRLGARVVLVVTAKLRPLDELPYGALFAARLDIFVATHCLESKSFVYCNLSSM